MEPLTCQTGPRCGECWHFRESVGCTLAFRVSDTLRGLEAPRPRELPLFSIVFRETTAPAEA